MVTFVGEEVYSLGFVNYSLTKSSEKPPHTQGTTRVRTKYNYNTVLRAVGVIFGPKTTCRSVFTNYNL